MKPWESFTPHNHTPKQPGILTKILKSHLFRTGLFIGTIFAIAYLIKYNLYEYTKRTHGSTCAENLHAFEAAKLKAKRYPTQTQLTSTLEILPHLRTNTFPVCPSAGTYQNVLSLKQKTTCSLNGDPNWEPTTNLPDPKHNGYHDLDSPPTTTRSISLPDMGFLKLFLDNIPFFKTETPKPIFSPTPDR